MIHASTLQNKPKLDWKQYIKSKEDYLAWIDSGMMYVLFDVAWDEVEEYLKLKEKE